MLEVRRISAGYSRVEVLHDVSLDVGPGDCVALLGPNNAGKTTLLRVICGLLRPRAGEVRLEGRDLRAVPAVARVAAGIVQIPEGRHVFGDLTVRENLLVGGSLAGRAACRARMVRVFEQLPKLAELERRRAGALSGGEQQLVVIGRALMAEPRVLILDEPSLGLSPVAVDELFDTLRALGEAGRTMLLVEQNAHLSMELCRRAYLMRQGRIVREHDPEEMSMARVQEAYLS